MTPIRAILVALVGVLAVPQRADAQPRSGLPAHVHSDSAAWQRILVYVVESLGGHLVRAAHDSSRQPWRITVPADEPQRALLEAQLETLLRARPIVPEDTLVQELELGPLTVSTDTARTTIRTRFRRRCPGTDQLTGFANVDSVFVARHPGAGWSRARSARVAHADGVSCPTGPTR